jgi:hypothetical protein
MSWLPLALISSRPTPSYGNEIITFRPFKLRGPRGGYRHKRHSFQNKGDWGNREEYINDLIKAML